MKGREHKNEGGKGRQEEREGRRTEDISSELSRAMRKGFYGKDEENEMIETDVNRGSGWREVEKRGKVLKCR